MDTINKTVSRKSHQEMWSEYLIGERKLSQEVLNKAKLLIQNGNLSIPIFNVEGETIFHKHRTAPWSESPQPKYLYDKGSSVALYGIEELSKHDEFVITEGELDALSVRTCGMFAVSSTGGSLSFQQEWVPLFTGKKVTVLFDNDEVGMKGAFHVAKMIPNAFVAWIPLPYGKDANDVLRQPLGQKLLKQFIDRAFCFHLPGTEATAKEWNEAGNRIREQSRVLLSQYNGCPQIYRTFFQNVVEQVAYLRKPKRERRVISGSEKERALSYPISDILKVNRNGFALCPFHNEKTGSLKVYKDNHAYCFGGCAKRYDAIDIEMKIRGTTFTEALAKLAQTT